MEKFILRQMQERDAQAVALLTEELGYMSSVEAVGAWIARMQNAQSGQAAFVASLQGEIVGWIEVSLQYRLQAEPSALIGGLVVKEGYRGKGIGCLLCERAEQWAWQLQVRTVRVTSNSQRTHAHLFYRKIGYAQLKVSHVFEKHGPAERQ